MRKVVLALATAATVGATAIAAPAPAEAGGFRGFGPGLAGGLADGVGTFVLTEGEGLQLLTSTVETIRLNMPIGRFRFIAHAFSSARSIDPSWDRSKCRDLLDATNGFTTP